MLHRIRLAMQSGSILRMSGAGEVVEADETFIGGAARFMHKADRARKIAGTGRGRIKRLPHGLARSRAARSE